MNMKEQTYVEQATAPDKMLAGYMVISLRVCCLGHLFLGPSPATRAQNAAFRAQCRHISKSHSVPLSRVLYRLAAKSTFLESGE